MRPPPYRPLVVAHRGASALRAENTMPAFAAARRSRADAIELDIQLTRDDVTVVYHDKTLGKLSGGRRRIADHTLAELRRYDFTHRYGPDYQGLSVPTLDDVLDRFGGRIPLMLEIKADGERPRSERWHQLVRSVVEAVQLRGLHDSVYILGFDAAVLRAVLQREPQLRCVLNVGKRVTWSPSWRRAIAPMRGLCLPARFATAHLGHRVHRSGRQLWVYRCDTDEALSRALSARADAMITDDPGWLRRCLRAVDRAAGRSGSKPERSRNRDPADRR